MNIYEITYTVTELNRPFPAKKITASELIAGKSIDEVKVKKVKAFNDYVVFLGIDPKRVRLSNLKVNCIVNNR